MYHQHTLTGLLQREIPNNLFQLLAKLDHHLQDLRMKIAPLNKLCTPLYAVDEWIYDWEPSRNCSRIPTEANVISGRFRYY